MYDLILRGGTLVSAEGVVQGDLAVAEGRVAAVAPSIAETGQEEIDATGLHLFPGVIDAHVHFNEPGRTEWEGFATGSRALAAGGATACCEMPLNAHPPTLDAASFDLKRAAAERSALLDFALWGGLVPGNLEQMEELAARGVIGFKAFMSNSGIDDFPAADDLTLYEGMRRAAALGRLVAVHAESDAITGALARRAVAEGRTTARDYLDSRPVVAELEAIARAILLAGEAGCALHVVHVSTARGVALVAEARARGQDVSCETCPHYLVLCEDDLERLGAVAKCAPPLRSAAERDELWAQVADGRIPMIASDHSPAPYAMKAHEDLFRAWGGISGCQSLLNLLLSEGHARRGLPLPIIAARTSAYVARRFGLWPRKGSLAVGADADVALVDLGASYVLNPDDLFYRHRHTPYAGMALRGRVVRTIARGVTVYHDGQIVASPRGRLLVPERPGDRGIEETDASAPHLHRPTPDLQLLRPDHAPALLAFERENRAYFAASVPDRGDAFFAEFDTRYVQLLAWQAAGTDYLHVLVTERGEVVGRVNLTDVANGAAELGYRIARKAAGQGLATAAVRKVRALAATEYGLTRLRARATLDNPASHKVLEHNGFVAVGELTLNGKPAISYICELR